jgi:hypothetical protein
MARDADARLLPAGELVREAIEQFDRQADLNGQFLATRAHLAARQAAEPEQRVSDGAPYGNRTRVSALRGPRPRPLDEGSVPAPK